MNLFEFEAEYISKKIKCVLSPEPAVRILKTNLKMERKYCVILNNKIKLLLSTFLQFIANGYIKLDKKQLTKKY